MLAWDGGQGLMKEDNALVWILLPQTFQIWERLWELSFAQGKRDPLPFGLGQCGSVQAFYNHYLGNTWRGENGVSLSNPLCSSPGWGAQGLLWLLPPPLVMGSGVLFTVFLL